MSGVSVRAIYKAAALTALNDFRLEDMLFSGIIRKKVSHVYGFLREKNLITVEFFMKKNLLSQELLEAKFVKVKCLNLTTSRVEFN